MWLYHRKFNTSTSKIALFTDKSLIIDLFRCYHCWLQFEFAFCNKQLLLQLKLSQTNYAKRNLVIKANPAPFFTSPLRNFVAKLAGLSCNFIKKKTRLLVLNPTFKASYKLYLLAVNNSFLKPRGSMKAVQDLLVRLSPCRGGLFPNETVLTL